jgi:hypothetical protein
MPQVMKSHPRVARKPAIALEAIQNVGLLLPPSQRSNSVKRAQSRHATGANSWGTKSASACWKGKRTVDRPRQPDVEVNGPRGIGAQRLVQSDMTRTKVLSNARKSTSPFHTASLERPPDFSQRHQAARKVAPRFQEGRVQPSGRWVHSRYG